MSTKSSEPPTPEGAETTNVTIRLPSELAEFLDRTARAQFNTRGGIVRMAIANLRTTMERKPEEPPVLMAG